MAIVRSVLLHGVVFVLIMCFTLADSRRETDHADAVIEVALMPRDSAATQAYSSAASDISAPARPLQPGNSVAAPPAPVSIARATPVSNASAQGDRIPSDPVAPRAPD